MENYIAFIYIFDVQEMCLLNLNLQSTFLVLSLFLCLYSLEKSSLSYHSIISDVFNGRLKSFVQCLACSGVSGVENFTVTLLIAFSEFTLS